MAKSLYKRIIEKDVVFINTGYNYKGNILKRTMSSKMFTSNQLLYDYLMKLDDIIYQLFDNIKSIKNIMSIARDKDDRNYN